MHVPLICLSVIMTLRFVGCLDAGYVEDLSDQCSDDRNMNFYLTYGEGASDKLVKMITTEEQRSCNLTFTVEVGKYVLLVLEFPDKKEDERVCYTEESTSYMVRDDIENGDCVKYSLKYPPRKLSRRKLSIYIVTGRDLGSVKIIATSMTGSTLGKCSHSEIECIYGEKKLCMTGQALCDGHNNCGVYGSYDEDEIKCKEQLLSLFVIIISLVMIVLTICLLFAMVMCLVPKRKDPYVHNFDHTRSLFDCENEILSVEINISILFPLKIVHKSQSQHKPQPQPQPQTSQKSTQE